MLCTIAKKGRAKTRAAGGGGCTTKNELCGSSALGEGAQKERIGLILAQGANEGVQLPRRILGNVPGSRKGGPQRGEGLSRYEGSSYITRTWGGKKAAERGTQLYTTMYLAQQILISRQTNRERDGGSLQEEEKRGKKTGSKKRTSKASHEKGKGLAQGGREEEKIEAESLALSSEKTLGTRGKRENRSGKGKKEPV